MAISLVGTASNHNSLSTTPIPVSLIGFPHLSPRFSATLRLVQRLRGTLTDDDWMELRVHAVGAIAAAIHLDVALRRLVRERDGLQR